MNSAIVSALSRVSIENDDTHVQSCLNSAKQATSTPMVLLAESFGDTANLMTENIATTGISQKSPNTGKSNPQKSSRRTPNCSRAAQ